MASSQNIGATRKAALRAASLERRLRDQACRRASKDRRRSRSTIIRFTGEEWSNICAAFDHSCAYCGRPGELEVEHVLPLARGGDHCAENIVPACPECNRRKGLLTGDEFRALLEEKRETAA